MRSFLEFGFPLILVDFLRTKYSLADNGLIIGSQATSKLFNGYFELPPGQAGSDDESG